MRHYGLMTYVDGSTYQGQFCNNKKHGNGQFAIGLDVYVGSFIDGVISGHGIYKYSNGDVYEGEWRDGHKYGMGTYKSSNTIYEGLFENDNMHGYGSLISSIDGTQYQGNFAAGEISGSGTMTFPNGDIYQGDFVCGKRQGRGRLISFEFGDVYEGEFMNNKMNGQGSLKYGDGRYKYKFNKFFLF